MQEHYFLFYKSFDICDEADRWLDQTRSRVQIQAKGVIKEGLDWIIKGNSMKSLGLDISSLSKTF